ncbi:MAG: GntR family transcriptional regulator [Reyranella sp.]|nr:MAG: GntR family transcriptional regulator [Reyranella sp.]
MDRIAVRRELGSPLHHQIYLVLADGISTGRYGVGEVLPTEEQLTRMFSVSRITVRRAMESLNDAGLIERGAGRRTVVRAQLGRPMRMTMNSVIENIVAYGSETDARVVEFGYVEARGVVLDRLWQAAEKPVQRAVRVRSHEGVPIMHLTSYVPSALGETFTADDLNRIPMFQLLARAGAHLARGDQVVSATLADPTVASRLAVKVGAALIDMRRMMFDQKGRAVEYIEMLAVPDRMTMRMELGSGHIASAKAKRKPSRTNRK